MFVNTGCINGIYTDDAGEVIFLELQQAFNDYSICDDDDFVIIA